MRLIDIDERGRITRLAGAAVAPGAGLFRMVVQKGECWENAVLPEEQEYEIEQSAHKTVLRVRRAKAEDQAFNISLTLVVEEDGDELRFTGEIDNRDDALVTDLYYPCVGLLSALDGQAPMELLWPLQAGCRFPNIGRRLASMNGREMEHQMAIQYPGAFRDGGSMGYLMLRDEASCLYLGNHDEKFTACTLRAFGDPEGKGLVGVEIGRMAFVKAGEAWQIPEAVCRAYRGSWREGAKRYRKWADTWFDKRVPPEWVRRMNGYFLVINKQQFRKSCWPYERLGELYDHAVAHGLDVLGLFGWYDTGHDNGYPDLVPAPDLGGETALKKGLRDVHEKGGHASLYYQGNLIDTGSQFYREHGSEAEGKSRWNRPYIQQFDKALYSDFLRYFSGKVFSTACPGQKVWVDCMTEKARLAFGYGADAVLYDQIGGMGAYPCFNPAHRHERPSTSYAEGRKTLLSAIRDQAEANGPEFGFFSEHITDVYAQYLDMLHGMMSNPYSGDGESQINFPEMFRYTFPECIMTVRNSLPYMQPRVVNYALAHGMRFEMEIRYHTDKEYLLSGQTPEWTKYGFDMASLRRRHEDALLLGAYLDGEGVACDGRLCVKRFAGEASEALVIWNDTEEALPLDVSVAGKAAAATVDTASGEIPTPAFIPAQTVYVMEIAK